MPIETETYRVRPPESKSRLDQLYLYGLGLVIVHGTSVYAVEELKSETPQINIITETCKQDLKCILEAVLTKSAPSVEELNALLRNIKLEVARAVSEEYGYLDRSESLAVVVQLSPYIVENHTDPKYINKPVLLLLARAQLHTTDGMRPKTNKPRHKTEVRSLGFQNISRDSTGVVFSAFNKNRAVTVKPVGQIALDMAHNPQLEDLFKMATNQRGIIIIGDAQFYSFCLSQSAIKRASKRSELTDYKNESDVS